MMVHNHCVIWLDHAEAHVVTFDGDVANTTKIHAPEGHGHVHHRAGVLGTGKSALNPEFLKKIEAELRNSREFLVVGPGTAKLDLIRHIHKHAADLEPSLVGVETVDHPSDRQLAAYGKKYFVATDRMLHSDADVLGGVAGHHAPRN